MKTYELRMRAPHGGRYRTHGFLEQLMKMSSSDDVRNYIWATVGDDILVRSRSNDGVFQWDDGVELIQGSELDFTVEIVPERHISARKPFDQHGNPQKPRAQRYIPMATEGDVFSWLGERMHGLEILQPGFSVDFFHTSIREKKIKDKLCATVRGRAAIRDATLAMNTAAFGVGPLRTFGFGYLNFEGNN